MTTDEMNALLGSGLVLPSPAYLFGSLLFSCIGYAAYRYGKKVDLPRVKWLGVALMLFPYVVDGTGWMYACGAALCVMLYLFRH